MGRSTNDGLGRLGGREKGTPNKKSKIVESLLDFENINLPMEILECCKSLKPLDKASVMLKLMEFIYPKKKAIAVDLKQDEEKVTKIIFHEVGSRGEVARLRELEAKEKRLEAILNSNLLIEKDAM